MKTKPTILLSAIALAASAALSLAQNAQNPGDAGGRGNRGDRGGTPEEFRARMAERLKSSLKVTDDEWGILQPLIEKVTTKQRDAMSGRFGGFGGRGGPGGDRGPGGGGGGNTGGGAPGGDRPGAAESQALRDALEKDGTSAADIAAKLTAVREQRKKATAELTAARADLQKVVTARQEAVLFSMGILE